MSRFTGALTIDTGSRTRCEGSSAPAATWNTTGRSLALKAGDDAIGVPVLMELYDRMKAAPITPDLSAMWRELGVQPSGDSVVFDQGAPLAAVVRSIMATRSGPAEAAQCAR